MITRLIARQKRFWHCLSHNLRFDASHCMLDVVYFDPERKEWIYGLACTCGKKFHVDGPHVSMMLTHILREGQF